MRRQAFHLPEELAVNPARIHLVADPDTLPTDPARVAELEELGFAAAPGFTIEEMPGCRVFPFFRAEPTVVAVLYEQEGTVWCDVHRQGVDGSSLTVSNAPTGSELDQPPGAVKRFHPEADIRELWDRFQAEPMEGEAREITPGNFAAVFELACADEMDWRIDRGGVTREEVERIARAGDEDVDDETLETLEGIEGLQAFGAALERGMRGGSALYEAVHDGSVEKVKLCLERGEDVDRRDMGGKTPLHTAIQEGHGEVALALIAGGADVNALLAPEAGSEIYAGNDTGQTPLMLAARAGDAAVVAALLEAGADARVTVDTSVALAGMADVLERQKQEGRAGNPYEGATALLFAARAGGAEATRLLLAAGAEVGRADASGETPLGCALAWGHRDVAVLLEEAGAQTERRSRYVLIGAVRAGDAQGVASLLAAGADPDARDRDPEQGSWPLIALATRTGQRAIVEALVGAGADVDAKVETRTPPLDRSALQIAAEAGRVDLVDVLVRAGSEVDHRDGTHWLSDEGGQTALQIAAEGGHTDVVRALVAAGARVGARSTEGSTALGLAAAAGRLEVVRALVEAGAEVDVRDGEGATPLVEACSKGHEEVVRLLLDAGADPAARGKESWSALGAAVSEDHTGIVRMLLAAGAAVDEPGGSLTPVGTAILYDKTEILRLLLERGVDPNCADDEGDTPLHAAARAGGADLVRTFLASGADVSLQDDEGRTALALAASQGHVDVTRLLLDAGADPNVRDEEGLTALNHALDAESRELIALLESVGAEAAEVSDEDDDEEDEIEKPLRELRGIGCTDSNDTMVLVKAGVEEVAAAFQEHRGAEVWQRNAYGEEIELTNRCFVVFRFAGHGWTTLRDEHVHLADAGRVAEEDARVISEKLGARAIFFFNSDTAGSVGYSLFERGELVEKLDYGERFGAECDLDAADDDVEDDDTRFESTRRDLEASEIDDPWDFADAFLKEEDAFAPSWSGGWCAKAGDRRVLQIGGIEADEFERMDFVACR